MLTPGAAAMVTAGAYLAGSIPFGLLLTRAAGLGDIRAIGSGNIGATNVLRTGRRGLAAATLLLDAAKGLAAVLASRALAPGGSDGSEAGALAAVLVTIGHCAPPWLGFRGGKGVATALGALAGLDWRLGAIACLAWLAAARLSRRSSVGAIAGLAAAALASVGIAAAGGRAVPALAACGLAALVIARHAGNIGRLLDGTEPRIGGRA